MRDIQAQITDMINLVGFNYDIGSKILNRMLATNNNILAVNAHTQNL